MKEIERMSIESPIEVVQRQLTAYNAKDMEAWLSTYAVNAKQTTLHGELIAQGHEEMRSRIISRFSEPDLAARLLSRTVMNNIVVDFEVVTRNFPEGPGTIEMICIYEVVNGLIQNASFALGQAKFT